MTNKKIRLKRILGRKVCSKCDQTFNDYFNPATSYNHECNSKFLQKRSDDNEDTVNPLFMYLEIVPISIIANAAYGKPTNKKLLIIIKIVLLLYFFFQIIEFPQLYH